ncbi:hypothetical protein, partial [Streptomyces tibetensis]|uniref:hypothetical protein n=1 Tax=Streptomyces tibetensis TaxID=2382123 RepID=UPI0033DF94A1
VTDMPTTLAKTYRQRLRWARSWWWMLPFVYARHLLHQVPGRSDPVQGDRVQRLPDLFLHALRRHR